MLTTRSGIVTVGDLEGHIQHAGMGIVVAPKRLLTCAHVVNTAMGRDKNTASRPENIRLRFSFPYVPKAEPVIGSLVKWLPPPPSGQQLKNSIAITLDAAMFEIEGELPPEVGVARLAALNVDEIKGKVLDVFGMVSSTDVGGNIRVRLVEVVRDGKFEMIGDASFGRFIDGGFSGGAVWYTPEKVVVGMVTSRIPTPEMRTAYAVPVTELTKHIPQLDVEHRYVSETDQRLFSVLGIFAFTLMFIHFLQLVLPGTEILLVPWTQGERFLGAFFGAHAFALMLPVYALILRHALSFRIDRPWYVRLPSILRRWPENSLRNKPGGAIVLLIFLVLFTFCVQLSYMQTIFNDTIILVKSSLFSDPKFSEGFTTDCRAHRYCVHRNVNHFNFLGSPKTIISQERYWDDAYRIAQAPPSTGVTYYPFIQPIILISITIFGALQVGSIFLVLVCPVQGNRLLITTHLGILAFNLRPSRNDIPS